MEGQSLQEVGELPEPQAEKGWVLKELKPRHKLICVYLSQGMKNIDVAKLVDCTPEYITMLLRQPLIKDNIARISDSCTTHLEALFAKSVEVIGEVLDTGTHGDKLKAARLQMEATHRIGRPDPMAGQVAPSDDRLERLAQRIIELNSKAKIRSDNETAEDVSYKEVGLERPVLEGTFTKGSDKQANGSAHEDS